MIPRIVALLAGGILMLPAVSTAAYYVDANDLEWRDLTETVNFDWNEINGLQQTLTERWLEQ